MTRTISRSDFLSIKPTYTGIRYSEEFYKEYYSFRESFNLFFSNFPDDVIIQWPYEHFDDFAGEFRWDIGYDKLEFHKDYFRTEDFKLLAAENYDNSELLEMGLFHFYDDEYVANYIREYLTYPKPIIVLDSKNSFLDGGYDFKKPYHLLEGHRRSWLMLALTETRNPEIPDKHEIWKVTRRE